MRGEEEERVSWESKERRGWQRDEKKSPKWNWSCRPGTSPPSLFAHSKSNSWDSREKVGFVREERRRGRACKKNSQRGQWWRATRGTRQLQAQCPLPLPGVHSLAQLKNELRTSGGMRADGETRMGREERGESPPEERREILLEQFKADLTKREKKVKKMTRADSGGKLARADWRRLASPGISITAFPHANTWL